MTQITLTLTPYQESMLVDALTEQVRKWHNIAYDARHGIKPNASFEGAELLETDARSMLDAVVGQLKANQDQLGN